MLEISDKIELHTHIRDGDVMRMRRLDNTIILRKFPNVESTISTIGTMVQIHREIIQHV